MLRMGYDEDDISEGRFAQLLLDEAAVEDSPAVFSATGHSRQNISVAHQQVRCVNLAWAFIQAKKVRHGSVVAIVGGGFSGLFLSVALAVQRRCIVYILEKERRLLHNFRSAPFRYISPNLNTRDLPPRYDPDMETSFVEKVPLFKWRADAANEVAHQWLHEFREYAVSLPIFTLTDTEVLTRESKPDGTVALKAKTGQREFKITADLAIMATGFGEEGNPLNIQDWSYWRAASPLQYLPGRRVGERPKVIIAGCGDSGIVELVHHVFKNFRHEHLPHMYPRGAEGFIQTSLDQSTIRNLRDEQQNEEFGELISELGWFYNSKHLRDANPSFSSNILSQGGDVERMEIEVLRLISRIVEELGKVGVKATKSFLEPKAQGKLTKALQNLSKEKQLAVRKGIEKDIASLASIELEAFMRRVDLLPHLKNEFQPGALLDAFDILLVDTTPTPYTEGLSPINLAYLKLCQDAQAVEYRQGRLKCVEETDTGLLAHFEEGPPVRCDRVLSRFGVKFGEIGESLLGTSQPRFHHGDYLLTSPVMLRDGRYVVLGIEALEKALVKRRQQRRGRQAEWWVPKSLFMGVRILPENAGGILHHLSGWIVLPQMG